MSVIEANKVRFSWDEQAAPIIHINRFSMSAGEQVLLHGPSGCGKSTFLALLTGILAPQQGSITLQGETLTGQTMSQRDRLRARHTGIIFQAFNLLPYLSARDNVLLGSTFAEHASATRQDGEELLRALGLPEAIWQQPAGSLSFGQQQRVAAARALLGKPALIIADEPTSALDKASRDALLALLLDVCDSRGSALLMVSHDTAMESLFQRKVDFTRLNEASSQAVPS